MSLEIWYFIGMALSVVTLWLTVTGFNKLTKDSPKWAWAVYIALWAALIYVWVWWAGVYPGPV